MKKTKKWALNKNMINAEQTKLSKKKVQFDKTIRTLLVPYEDKEGKWRTPLKELFWEKNSTDNRQYFGTDTYTLV